jgi:energy-coupling factor transport system permease protein
MLMTFAYIKRDSFVHRLDPRVKLVLLFAFSFAMYQTINFWVVLVGFLISLIYYRAARLKWEETKGTWRFVFVLVAVIVCANFLLSGGAVVPGLDVAKEHILFSVPFLAFQRHAPFIGPTPLHFTVENIVFLFTQAMRILSAVLFAIPISYTTNPGHLGVTFSGLGVPDRVSYAIDLSLRFMPTLARDFSVTLDAQRARGFEIDRLRGGIFSKVARLAPMIVPVVIGSIVGAEDIVSAMELRCFGIAKRTWITELHLRPLDSLLIGLGLLWFVVITTINIIGAIHGGPWGFLHQQGIPHFLVP